MDGIRIAHISDLHFGLREWPPRPGYRTASAVQETCWEALRDQLNDVTHPDLVVVTGDIVDSPGRDVYKRAAKALSGLRADSVVCFGNHDLHTIGNNFGGLRYYSPRERLAQLVEVFGDRAASRQPRTIEVNGRRIGVCSLDSSTDTARGALATGYVPLYQLDELEQAVARDLNAGKWDLLVLLVHHHVLAIAAVEEGGKAQAFSPTAFVNSSQVLERCIDIGVDVVLHGHEHVRNFARYGSAGSHRRWRSEVGVAAAASGTGVVGSTVCRLETASYNVIELDEIGEVRATAMRCDLGGAWRSMERAVLARPEITREHRLVRHARLLRPDARDYDIRLASTVKHVHFLSNSDIETVNFLENMWYPDSRRSIVLTCATGTMSEVKLAVLRQAVVQQTFSGMPTRGASPSEWSFAFTLPDECVQRVVTLHESHRFIGGGLLTEAALQAARARGQDDNERQEGFEFVWFPVPETTPIRRTDLLLTLPSQSGDPEVELLARRSDRSIDDAESRRIASGRRRVVQGHWHLTVDLPRQDRRYIARWLPAK